MHRTGDEKNRKELAKINSLFKKRRFYERFRINYVFLIF